MKLLFNMFTFISLLIFTLLPIAAIGDGNGDGSGEDFKCINPKTNSPCWNNDNGDKYCYKKTSTGCIIKADRDSMPGQ